MNNKIFLWLCFFVFILLTFYFSDIPFFWDGTFVSEVACKLYDGTYKLLPLPPIHDNNTVIPVFSFYLFAVWKLFSKSLLISHLALLPFLIGIVYEFYKLCKLFLKQNIIPFALLLLMLEPTFMTQSILMSYDIILLYLFLLLLNLLLIEKYITFSLIIPFLAMYSVRGIFLAFSLAIIQLVLLYPNQKSKSILVVLKNNILSLAIVIALIIYKFNSGCDANSLSNLNAHEQLISVSMMFRQFAFIVWKIADFGRVSLCLCFIIGMIYFYKTKNNLKEFKTILLIIFIPTLITIVFIIPFSNPISHRYFMFTYLLLIIGVCFILQQIKNKKIIYSLVFIFSVFSVSGNLWLYPEQLGNGWDSSLKVIPYFHLKDEMDKFIIDNKIDVAQIGTQYPLIADKKYSHLAETSFYYTNVWSGPITYNYFLFTNVINSDITDQIEKVKTDWQLVKSFSSGEVYVNLYKKK